MNDKSEQQITAALEGITNALRVDGYALEVEDVSDTLSLRIRALEDACEDCLVPAGVMAQTISGALKGAFPPDRIQVAYPAGAAH
jgi:Fe-S cluster biogenesis protein NfuA